MDEDPENLRKVPAEPGLEALGDAVNQLHRGLSIESTMERNVEHSAEPAHLEVVNASEFRHLERLILEELVNLLSSLFIVGPIHRGRLFRIQMKIHPDGRRDLLPDSRLERGGKLVGLPQRESRRNLQVEIDIAPIRSFVNRQIMDGESVPRRQPSNRARRV